MSESIFEIHVLSDCLAVWLSGLCA